MVGKAKYVFVRSGLSLYRRADGHCNYEVLCGIGRNCGGPYWETPSLPDDYIEDHITAIYGSEEEGVAAMLKIEPIPTNAWKAMGGGEKR